MLDVKLKGIEKFREKIPNFHDKRIIFLPLYLLTVLTISLTFQLMFDMLPVLFYSGNTLDIIFLFFPIFGTIIMGIIALLMIYQVWARRDKLKEKYGQLSYQKIFLVGFGGVIIIFSIVLHTFIGFYYWNSAFWSQFPYSILAKPLTSYFSLSPIVFDWIRLILGVFLCVLGIITLVAAAFTFGFDYMTVVYLYFPEESSLQDHKIYSVLRHPAYTGALITGFGGAVYQLTPYSIIFFLILYGLLLVHIHFVEEKELINRFGDSYTEYRKKVPAFFVRPKNWGKFFRFIFLKS